MHIWSLAEGRLNATLHARIASPDRARKVTAALRAHLHRRNINHVTIEVDVAPAEQARPDC